MYENLRAALLCVALLCPATAGFAQERDDAAPMLHGQLELSLGDAIRMGLENNLGVQVERFSPIIAQLDAEAAWGAYDPELYGELGFEDARNPTANRISTGNLGSGTLDVATIESRRFDGFTGLRGSVPVLGASYSVQFNGEEIRDDAFFRSLKPEYNAGLSFTARMPLLRNLIWNEPWTQVRTTSLLHQRSLDAFRSAVMDEVQRIEDAYWQLIADEEEVRVARKSLETARALLDQTRTQFEVGVVSRVEVTEAEAGVESREFNLIVSRNRYRNQQDVLIDLVLGPGLRAASTLELRPTDRAEEFVVFDVDVKQAVDMAFTHRPDLAAQRKELERLEVQAKFRANQRLPGLDVEGNYTLAGISGQAPGPFTTDTNGDTVPDADPVPPHGFNVNGGDFTDKFPDGNSWSVRGILTIPLLNTSARKAYDRSRFELHRGETELRRLEQSIILDVRRSARNLEAAQEGIESALRATEAAEEQLRAEKIRHEYGEATPFDVLQREEDLVEEELRRIDAYRAYRVSATALDRDQGTILRNRNIRIDEVTALR